MNILPINLDDLIYARAVESVRREFKKTWSQPTLTQTIRTICAFANDFFNLNGGYIVIGIEEHNGLPSLPPEGLDQHNLDDIQKQIRGQCKRLEPEYQPILSPEIYQGKSILVIWVPASDLRPHQAPTSLQRGERVYVVRQGSESVAAQGSILTQLMQMTAKIPFDDRRNLTASIEVLSPSLVRNFLAEINSNLVAAGVKLADAELYRNLQLSVKVNGYEVPKNVALLFFIHNPEEFLPGARIEVVQFGDNAGGELIEETIFRGPLQIQIRQALHYLNTFSTTMIKKIPNQAVAQRTVTFPYEAMAEALVNAVYHRSYDGVREPTKVYLYPDRIEIISYPGPVPGLEQRHFQANAALHYVPNRNRRIGDFLKELKLAEGRGTGIPKIRRKMGENGSPEPIFDFDESRTYFRVILPAHPQYIVIHALRESAYLWTVGDKQAALANLAAASQRVPDSGALIAHMIESHATIGQSLAAERLFAQVEANPTIKDRHLSYVAIAKVFLDQQQSKKAAEILSQIPTSPTKAIDLVELAVLYKRSQQLEEAHRIFTVSYDLIKDDPQALYEYALTKSLLATELPTRQLDTKKRLTKEAIEQFRRVMQLSNDNLIQAWCWYRLAKSYSWLRLPKKEIEQAYETAIKLLPNESRFKKALQRWHHQRVKRRK